MPFVIPVFIPHRGCPHCCLFCNQHAITGADEDSAASVNVEETIEIWLKRNLGKEEVHLAYYGGSFSCLSRREQERLLIPAQRYLQDGRIHEIRISTRPDCLTDDKLEYLRSKGVGTVELGVQSFSDRVLQLSRRGHDADGSRAAIRLLREKGFSVGIQLMLGLPGETSRSFMQGIKEAVAWVPALVRLYPALVLHGSDLADWFQKNEYRPLSLAKAVIWTAKAKEMLNSAGIPVVRMGLQPSTSLEQQLIAGPYHPAFGELVLSRQWFCQMRQKLAELDTGETLTMLLSSQDISAVVGEKRRNIIRLNRLGYGGRFQMRIEKERKRGCVEYVVGK